MRVLRRITFNFIFKTGTFVLLLICLVLRLKHRADRHLRLSHFANSHTPCITTSSEDYSKTRGYSKTHVSNCIDPICNLNEGHKPVARKRSRFPCHQLSDCVTALVKTKHRIHYVKIFIESLHSFYPDVPVIVADEITDLFNNTDIPREWLKLEYNVITYIQVRAGVGYGRQISALLAESPYVLIGDDDFMFTNKTDLTKLVSVLSTTTVDIVGGAVGDSVLFDGALRVMQSNATQNQSHLVLYPGVFYEAVPCHPKCLVADIVKNFFLANREVLVKAGGWDVTRLFYEHEDFFFQMRKKRVTIAHCSDVIIGHDGTDRTLEELRLKQLERWSKRLKEKWGFADYYYCPAKDYPILDGCPSKMTVCLTGQC